MKTGLCKITLAVGLLCSGTHLGWAQGFINLDFESANLATIPAGQYGFYVSSLDAIPGWAASIDGKQVTQVLQNNGTLGDPSFSIWGPTGTGFGVLQGRYSVVLTGGYVLTGSPHVTSISQTGLVPVSARTLLFIAQPNYHGAGILQVTLGGQILDCLTLSTGPNYSSYAADISAFDGQTVPLTFSAISFGSNFSYQQLDAIQFSSSPVPEPTVYALAALGTLLFSLPRRRN